MNTRSTHIIISVLLAAVAEGACRAEGHPVDMDFSAAAGMKHDSDVAVVELDSRTSESDAAVVLEAGLGMQATLTNVVDVELAYDYVGTDYRDVPEFDLDLHHAHAHASVTVGNTDAALAVDRFAGILAGHDYLVLTQVSPSVSRLFGTRLFLRGAYIRAEKSYAELTARDATSDALRSDVYMLFDGMDHFVALGVQITSEDAADAGYDYAGATGTLTWGHRFALARTDVRLNAQLRYEQREYRGATQDSGETRFDERIRARLDVTIPFSDHVWAVAWIEHTDNDSTFADAVLDRSVYGLKFGFDL